MHILYFFIFINQILTQNINHYSTESYIDLDWTKIKVSKIEVYFIDDISRSNFKRIYLTNGTIDDEIDITNHCFFYTRLIRCIVSPTIINGEPNNKKYKYYYRLKYQLKNDTIESAYVTVSVNNGFIIKYSLFFLLFLLF